MNGKTARFQELRKAAEELLASKKGSKEARLKFEDIGKLIEELELYHFELNLANEELNRLHSQFLEARDKYADLYEFAPVGYITLTLWGSIEQANITAAKLLSCERNRLYRARFVNFLDKESIADFDRAFNEAISKQCPSACEIRLDRPDSPLQYLHINFVPEFDDDGKLDKIRATLTDITSLKETQNELERAGRFIIGIVETARVPILVVDSRRNVVISNRAFLMFGHLPKHNVQGKNICEIGKGLWNIPEFENLVTRVMEKRDPVEDYEIDHEFDSIGRKVILVSARPLRENRHLPARVLISFTDITELRRGREIYQEQAKLLEQKNRDLLLVNQELEAFTYTASHDLRAPLRSMMGFSRIVLEEYGGKLDEKGRDYLKRIDKAGRTMNMLVDGLLKLSRVNQSSMNYLKFDLSELIGEHIRKITSEEPSDNIEFFVAPGMVITGDRVLFDTVIENLLTNAIKFTGKMANPKIEFGKIDIDGNETFYVRDNGVGFDMARANELFLPFKRLHDPAEYPGTGIGLATVNRIIRRHDGKIWAESEPGKGTTFYFTLGQTGREQL